MADKEVIRFREAVAALFRPGPFDVLDVGGGAESRYYVVLPERARVAALDISLAELQKNRQIDFRIIGDAQRLPVRSAGFYVVTCCNVLEHLPDPRTCLQEMARAMEEGGLSVIAAPNGDSVKAIFTRLTPHWFHRLFWEHIYGVGRAKSTPFRTYMRREISPRLLTTLARGMGLRLINARTYEPETQTALRQRYHLTGRLWQAVQLVVSVCTRGGIDAQNSECLLVFQKDGASLAGYSGAPGGRIGG